MNKISKNIYLKVPKTYEEALNSIDIKNIVVMGGIVPGQTTDTVASIMAEYTNAELLLIATSVDGIYTSDPNVNIKAKKFDTINIKKIIDMSQNLNLKAGSKSPIDPIACKIIERSKINTIIYDGKDISSLKDIIYNKKSIFEKKYCCGTIIEFEK